MRSLSHHIYWAGVLVVGLICISCADESGTGRFFGSAEPVPSPTPHPGGRAVRNKEPEPGMVRYSPAEGEVVTVTPPRFVWLPDDGADRFRLQVSRERDFSTVAYEKHEIPLNLHSPPRTFEPGVWYWRYTFIDEDNGIAQWSKTRSFTIAEDARAMPQPTVEALIANLPQTHPKIWLRPENLVELQESLPQAPPPIWQNFVETAEAMLETEVITQKPDLLTEAEIAALTPELYQRQQQARRQIDSACEHVANLAFAGLITGELRFSERAKQWLLAMAEWPVEDSSTPITHPTIQTQLLSRLSRAYTWLYSHLSTSELRAAQSAIQSRANWIGTRLFVKGMSAFKPYQRSVEPAVRSLTEAAIVMAHNSENAADWLQFSMDYYYNLYPVWSGRDGGWHQGLYHWQNEMAEHLDWLEIVNTAFDITADKTEFLQTTGDFPLYVLPPGSQPFGFGDRAREVSKHKLGQVMQRLAIKTRNPHWLWYAQNIDDTPSQAITYRELLASRHSPDVSPQPPHDWPPSKVFRDVGIASLHNTLTNPREDMHLLFKSSPLGTPSHGNDAQNAFAFAAFGKRWLDASGEFDVFGSPHHSEWIQAASSSNTITVDGHGQLKNSPAAIGKITDHTFNERLSYVSGEAGQAYGGRLNQFKRHVFFIRPNTVFLLDELDAPQSATFTAHLNSDYQIRHSVQTTVGVADENASGVRIGFATPVMLALGYTNQWNPVPAKEASQQWHFTASTPEALQSTQMMSLLLPTYEPRLPQLEINYTNNRDVEIYGFVVDDYKLGLISNSDEETYAFGPFQTDARYLLIVEDKEAQANTFTFAVNCSRYQFKERAFRDADSRANLYVSPEDYAPLF